MAHPRRHVCDERPIKMCKTGLSSTHACHLHACHPEVGAFCPPKDLCISWHGRPV